MDWLDPLFHMKALLLRKLANNIRFRLAPEGSAI
jgi:hypothetical protein